jgi:hypothetical protein
MPVRFVSSSCQAALPAPDAAIGAFRRFPKSKAVGKVEAVVQVPAKPHDVMPIAGVDNEAMHARGSLRP